MGAFMTALTGNSDAARDRREKLREVAKQPLQQAWS
jgi:hypothetical protein